MNKKSLGIIALLVGVVAVIMIASKSPVTGSGENLQRYKVVQKWQLPQILEEVSGIEWLDRNKIACVQDEDGMIFIFDLATSKIKNKIKFSGSGDYEGIAVSKGNAYVLRSDGTIFEILNFFESNTEIQQYETSLTDEKGIDVEGLCFDKKQNQLLVAVKSRKESDSFKGVYAFDLQTKKLKNEPVYKISLTDPLFKDLKGKLEEKFNPSEVEIHPTSGKLYILDGRNPKLLIAGKNPTPEELYILNKKEFSQPEGITFHPDGSIYISNEAGDEPANILQVSLEGK